ncbi:MAG: sulfurtransferase complex subunit TusD [Methylococcales bacterium]|nr:sulfurtransferase complex subunit TusD [Methylococcales bacterium]
MKFALQINSSPYHSSASLTAFRFATEVLAQHHEIFRVFFYHDGIYHALKWANPPDDEISIFKNWSELAQKYDLDLVVCISAAQRRGLINENVADGFRLGGLGQLLEATILADRFLVFG